MVEAKGSSLGGDTYQTFFVTHNFKFKAKQFAIHYFRHSKINSTKRLLEKES